jgi:hypothetical protein
MGRVGVSGRSKENERGKGALVGGWSVSVCEECV